MRRLLLMGALALCCVPSAESSSLGIEVDDVTDLRPQMPGSTRALDVQGRARCTFDDQTPATTTYVRLLSSSAAWRINFPYPTIRLDLDSTRCADPTYVVPFRTWMEATPSFSAEPFEEKHLSILVDVQKAPPQPALPSYGSTAFNATMVADQVVAGEIDPAVYASSMWGRVHVEPGATIVVPILVSNRGTGNIQMTIDPPVVRSGDVRFDLPSGVNLSTPLRPHGGPSHTTLYTNVTVAPNWTGEIEFSLTVRGASVFPHVQASFNETILYSWIVREPAPVNGFAGAQFVAALAVAICLRPRSLRA